MKLSPWQRGKTQAWLSLDTLDRFGVISLGVKTLISDQCPLIFVLETFWTTNQLLIALHCSPRIQPGIHQPWLVLNCTYFYIFLFLLSYHFSLYHCCCVEVYGCWGAKPHNCRRIVVMKAILILILTLNRTISSLLPKHNCICIHLYYFSKSSTKYWTW